MSKIPHISNDAIGAVVLEELGLTGLCILIGFYLFFLQQAIISRLVSNFSNLLFVGLSAAIVLQAFYNMSGILGVVPITGIVLPFVSNSGIAVFSSYLAVGLMMELPNNFGTKSGRLR